MSSFSARMMFDLAAEAEAGYDPSRLRPRPRKTRMIRPNPNQECCEDIAAGLFEHHTDRCTARQGRWLVRRDGWAASTVTPWTVWRFNTALNAYGAWAVCRTQLEACTVVKKLMRKYANEPPEQEPKECTVA